jgi:carboxyl-terminal processing protease
MKLFRALLFSLFFVFALEARLPQIGPKDVKIKIEEILKSHASHKQISPEILKRALVNFVEELDPTKTYFLSSEVETWLQPSDELIATALIQYKNSDFSLFQQIHSLFIHAIQRRAKLEEAIALSPTPTGVKSEEFSQIGWAHNVDELQTRLLRIRGLQLEVAERLGDDTKSKFFQRLTKRRLNRESELTGQTEEDRLKITLTYFLKSCTSALDAHTNYFTPSEANQFMIQVQQRLFGIGAQLRDDLDGLSVVRILENSPASQSQKLKIFDKIIAVNGEPIVGMDIAEAVELIRGEKGTPVLLTLLRDKGEGESEKLEIELIRNEVVIEESRLETSVEPYGDGAIAAFKLFSFYQDQRSSAAGDIRKALEQLRKEHSLRGVILDLRGNAGGLLSQAVSVTGLFINRGIVCSIKDNTGKLQHLRELEGKPVWEGPLIVLVDRASASAAEIVAQTLQDYGRALVVGDDHTFGKGSFQTFTLDAVQNTKVNPQGEYKVTRGRYYTVSGKSPQLKGVQSSIVIPGLLSKLEVGEEYSKFPLEYDEIEPHFEDDLSDLSPLHRLQLGPMYKYNLQARLSTYDPFVDLLTRNSADRIKANKNYQSFLEELTKKNFDSEAVDLFGHTDLQMAETLNVMKDLIFLMDKKQPPAPLL